MADISGIDTSINAGKALSSQFSIFGWLKAIFSLGAKNDWVEEKAAEHRKRTAPIYEELGKRHEPSAD